MPSHNLFSLSRSIIPVLLAWGLLSCSIALAQSPQQRVVLIRNVRVIDGGVVSPVGAVLVTGSDLIRLGAHDAVPPDAIVIDAGGSLLTTDADGAISLKPPHDAAASSPENRSTSLAKQSTVASSSSARATLWRNGESKDTGRADKNAPLAPPTRPQQPSSQAGADEDLASKVVDPTAPLKTITFQNKYTPSLWGIDDDLNEGDIQLGIPLQFLGRANIMRVTIPYLTSAPSGIRGLNDVAVFDILLFPQKWGTPVVGAVASFGVNKGPGVDTFAIGPAVGAVFKKEKLTYGVFNQNLFSADDIAITQIQPILAYTLNKKISIAFGDQQMTYDWKLDRWVLVPVGFQVNYIARIGNQPIRLLAGPQYNIKNEFGARKWTITTGFALILK